VVSDASSSGFAYYVGVPWIRPGLSTVHVGAWTPAQSVCSSNWRESYTLLLCVRNIMMQSILKDAFVAFISDNQCAVAIATHLYSPTESMKPLARALRELMTSKNAQCVGFHIPGLLNHFADAPSRATGKLYGSLASGSNHNTSSA
jgi:hypothetical protein